ncbi:hypothetical protein [Agriterribacter sp.]|uniref:ORC-CDC6 family AAA ATPase n=1 Tax=Agriterribacter sp. TaxID=2821509 RepID=UPI002CDE95D1|nr:hypothetical protein [Agriterribacter sp.]HTN07597.1 hypothetical protein [Agriterribacter sp.]
MRVDINPFYTRASDNIDSEEKFIKLFSPEILLIFKDYPIWHAVNVLRSSPGGGKTTLLKMFTPKILASIKNSKNHDDHAKELFNVLTELEVFNSKGDIHIAAALISFSNQYTNLEYLNLPGNQKIRLFCSLLNTRIILSVLKSICLTKDLNYPQDLRRLTFTEENNIDIPVHLRDIKNALQLYEWATNEEEKISDQIDSIYSDVSEVRGGDSFYPLDLLAPSNLKLDGNNIDVKVVVMLDDVHNLSVSQRGFLVKAVIDKRPLVNTWISERLKALTMEELLSEGSLQGRDNNIIILENFWAKRHVQFEKFAKSVANRRVEVAFENKMDFASFLSIKMSNKYQTVIKEALEKVEARIKSKYSVTSKYVPWIKTTEELDEDEYNKLVEWRALEILIYRDSNKVQQTLAFEDLEVEALEHQNGNDVKVAAQLFLHDEFKIPFYYGISTVSRLASSNIEQFLNIAGELFDLVQTNSVKKIINSNHQLGLSPEKQEEVIKKIVSLRWKDLSTNVPLFDDVKKLMDSIGQFCYSETYVPNAWNSPGINGIAITMAQRNEIKDTILKDKNHQYYKLARCLTICIAYNLIDFKLNYKCKGREWMILYINRIYCAKYQLPLNNGKFKEKTLKDLLGWLNNGITIKPKLNV